MKKSLKALVLIAALSFTHQASTGPVIIAAAASCVLFIGGWFVSGLQGNSFEDLMFFSKEVYKNPTEMGAGFPCSKYLARASIAKIPAKTNIHPRSFLEVGAGTGVVTNEFIKKFKDELRNGSTFDVVELQQPLCDILEKKFAGTPGVSIHCTPIQKFNPHKKYDAIVMTVPFNSLPSSLVQEIWEHVTKNLLADGGIVSYVNYALLPTLKPLTISSEKKADFKKTQDYLNGLFKKHGIGKKYELRNVLPIRTRYLKFDELTTLAA